MWNIKKAQIFQDCFLKDQQLTKFSWNNNIYLEETILGIKKYQRLKVFDNYYGFKQNSISLEWSF